MWIIWGSKTHGSGQQQLQLTTHPSTETCIPKIFRLSSPRKKHSGVKSFLHTDNTYQTSARPQVKGSDFSQRFRVAAEFEMAHLIHSARKTRRHL